MYSFIYLKCPHFGQRGSKFNSHRPYKGIDLWNLDSHTSWLPRYAKLYLFWIILVIQSISVHFRWNRTNLKIWPPVKKVNDLLLIWPLSQEQNIVWSSCNWICCFLWPKEEFDMYYILIEICWLFWYHVALPSCDPRAPDWFMCPPEECSLDPNELLDTCRVFIILLGRLIWQLPGDTGDR